MADPPCFSLAALQAIESRIGLAYEGPVDPRTRDVRHRNPLSSFWVVQRGHAVLEINRRGYTVRQGQWVLIPPMANRHHLLTSDTELISLSFHWSWPLGEPVMSVPEPIIGAVSAHRRLCALARRAAAALNPRQSPDRDLRCRMVGVTDWHAFLAAFHAFLAQVGRVIEARGGGAVRPGAIDPRLAPILGEIAAGPTIGPLPYERWRSLAGIGREQIDRLARAHLGMTLHAWRNRQLAGEIRRRLLSGSVVIKAVAAELGFVDSAHFNRWCRRHLHVRPGELRGGGA